MASLTHFLIRRGSYSYTPIVPQAGAWRGDPSSTLKPLLSIPDKNLDMKKQIFDEKYTINKFS